MDKSPMDFSTGRPPRGQTILDAIQVGWIVIECTNYPTCVHFLKRDLKLLRRELDPHMTLKRLGMASRCTKCGTRPAKARTAPVTPVDMGSHPIGWPG